MLYEAILLNGAWDMGYSEDAYTLEKMPTVELTPVSNAVPAYWEDMAEAFAMTPFFGKLKINPEYGIQKYPIHGTVPDMALPNIIGNFFYKRSFACDNVDDVATLHFAGVQNAVSVWINDIYLGRHEGYSAEFEFGIPSGILNIGENTVFMSVSNHRLKGYDGEPVTGLTSRAANECTGGVTGDVEIRFYSSPLRDAIIFVADDCSKIDVKTVSTEPIKFDWEIYDGECLIKCGSSTGEFSAQTDGLERWSPENPKLYTLKIIYGDTVLTREFGVRRLLADGVHFRLNGVSYYLRGICEHCYFPETVHPNHDKTFYRNLIKKVKSLGFNFIRFHTFVPEEEYMQAADELGILVQVESPNNTTVEEWKEIVRACRRHTSVVIYCCGNEMMMDEPFIEHLKECSVVVHENTDSLFSPMSALRGLEYWWEDSDEVEGTVAEPFKHNPGRFKTVAEFSDMYNSYVLGHHSYTSLEVNPKMVDEWSSLYNKPRVSHEICIDGTYTNLSLKDRYKGSRIGRTQMLSSIEKHLEDKGILDKAPLYFRNSSEWQRRVRKYCFEATRMSENIAGYDFLGPIDTHWHTFGYDVGMMNEFYELKPGESVRNVLMYNSETVLLTDIGNSFNLRSGDEISFGVYSSYYGGKVIENAMLTIRLIIDDRVANRTWVSVDRLVDGKVSKLHDFSAKLPEVDTCKQLKLYITLEGDELFAENEWELYLFPDKKALAGECIITDGMSADELEKALADGKDVVIFGTEPFSSLPTTYQIALAGRTSGNLATVIADHPLLNEIPNEGFCGWQFAKLMEDGKAVCFECDNVPFEPIIEVVSTHKFAILQAALFEFRVLSGRLLVCGFKFDDSDPGAKWLRNRIIEYAQSDEFNPKHKLDEFQLHSLLNAREVKVLKNTNFAFNANDKTTRRRKE